MLPGDFTVSEGHGHPLVSTKEKGDKPDKIPSLEEPSPAVTACLEMEAACALIEGSKALASIFKILDHQA